MRYYALATDYDGTLAKDGKVSRSTIESLKRLKNSGRKLILVTGRELKELLDIFPEIELFEIAVVENGALLYFPHSREEKLLSAPPEEKFVEALKKAKISPFSVGKSIVATWRPYETAVIEIIQKLGLELQVIFNKDAVMILPSGVNKASGLDAALKILGFSRHNIIGVGDAENDHAFINYCEFSAAVGNALTSLKDRVDLVLENDHGDGVSELIDKIIATDLDEYENRKKLSRYDILVGKEGEKDVFIKPYNQNILISGISGGGKSTFALSFIERLVEKEYQFCIIDPEGDYEDLMNAIHLGEANRAPIIEEVISVLEKSELTNCVISLLGVELDQRPAFFEKLLPALLELKTEKGRPHWIITDEAHHLLPTNRAPAENLIPAEMKGIMYITVHPEHCTQIILSTIDLVFIIGKEPAVIINNYTRVLNEKAPYVQNDGLEQGEVVFWNRREGTGPIKLKSIPSKQEHKRHIQKYMEGELNEERSFYFRGRDGKLNLRAQNLQIFLQISEGIDEDTWLYHLKNSDYSEWFRYFIKDEELADSAAGVERKENISADESRKLIKEMILKRYTSPA